MEATAGDMIIPPLFRCPISLDLFEDPVTLSTGQTYDRSSIQRWLSQGKLTCPVTMQRLDDFSMVPNHTLRHLIHDWLTLGDQSGESGCTKGFPVSVAKRILESEESTLESKIQVLEKVHDWSLELPLKNYFLVRMGFFGAILEVVFTLHFELDLRVVERAVGCALRLMPFSDLRALDMLQEKAKYEGFLCLFEQGSMVIKRGLCLVVEAIVSSLEMRALCRKLGNSAKLVRQTVHLVKDRSEAAEAGIRAASALSTMQQLNCAESLVREGVIQVLIEYISENQDKGRLAAVVMSAVENLLQVETAKGAVISHPNGIKTIVRMVFRVSDHRGSESAVNSLTILCSDSLVAREMAVVEGVLIQLLLLLQSQCSGRTKGKATMLLKLIGQVGIMRA